MKSSTMWEHFLCLTIRKLTDNVNGVSSMHGTSTNNPTGFIHKDSVVHSSFVCLTSFFISYTEMLMLCLTQWIFVITILGRTTDEAEQVEIHSNMTLVGGRGGGGGGILRALGEGRWGWKDDKQSWSLQRLLESITRMVIIIEPSARRVWLQYVYKLAG